MPTVSVASRSCHFDEPPDLCLEGTTRGPLPELRDDLDDFFREVEYPPLYDLNEIPKELLSDTQTNLRKECVSQVSPAAPISAMLSTPFEKAPSQAADVMKLFQESFVDGMEARGVAEEIGSKKKIPNGNLSQKDDCYLTQRHSVHYPDVGEDADGNFLSCRRSRKRLASCAAYDLCVQPNQ